MDTKEQPLKYRRSPIGGTQRTHEGQGEQKPQLQARPHTKANLEAVYTFIKTTYNNTQITVVDHCGNTLMSTTAGMMGFKGPKRGTKYAAQVAGAHVAKFLTDRKLFTIVLKVSGLGMQREAALKGLLSTKRIKVRKIHEITPIAHNGCKPPKIRRT